MLIVATYIIVVRCMFFCKFAYDIIYIALMVFSMNVISSGVRAYLR